MKIAIVGGGWAGLSAAVELAGKAHDVVVFEASGALGGRARGVAASHLGITIDNGQHILLGAYTRTLDLIGSLTGDAERGLLRLPLTVQSADGAFRLQAARLPAPWHLLWAVIRARGLGLGDRLRLATLCHSLKSGSRHVPDDWTVARWLDDQRQSHRTINSLWQPLCLAAMNTPIDQACARTFCHVLRDALGGAADASNLLIPKTGLSDLWVNHLPDNIAIHCSRAVTRMSNENGSWSIDGREFDAAILACPPPATARLLGPLAQDKDAQRTKEMKEFLHTLGAFDYLPIATLTLQFASVWQLPRPMLMLAPRPAQRQYGQWLFNLNRIANADSASAFCATVVVSDARALLGQPRHDIASAIIEQVTNQTRHIAAMPELRGHELMIEKRATFAATPRLRRPANESPWPGLWVAGDWTDTGYPAVLEGAVRSGQDAARSLLKASQPRIRN